MVYTFDNKGGAPPLAQNTAKRVIVPSLTNGGMIRSMDNRRLAAWLAQQHENTAKRGAWTEEQYFRWLNHPVVDGHGDAESVSPNADAKCETALHVFPTCELVAELRTREGVETTVVEPYDETSIHASGPAIVLNVID